MEAESLVDQVDALNLSAGSGLAGVKHQSAWAAPGTPVESAIRDSIVGLARWADAAVETHSLVAIVAVCAQMPYAFQFESGRFNREVLYRTLFAISGRARQRIEQLKRPAANATAGA